MADNPVNPKPPQPSEPIRRDPNELLRKILELPQFQASILLPPIQPCPLKDLNIDIEFLYYYADNTPVPKAFVVLLNAEGGAPLMSAPLDSQGYRRMTVPKGVSYKFYFHHDKSPTGKFFDFDPPYLSKAGTAANPVSPWPSRQAVIQATPDVRFHWGYPDFPSLPIDPNKPLLERLILHVVSNYVPLEGGEPSMIEAALILEAMLLGSYNDDELWVRLVLNRLGFALERHSRLVQGIILYTRQQGAGIQLEPLMQVLNGTGKGNAVDWLRHFAVTRLPQAAKPVAEHIDGLVAAVRDELDKVGTGGAQDAFNQTQARYLRDRLNNIPAARAKVDAIINPAIGLLTPLTAAHPALRTPRDVQRTNIVRQVRSKLPEYIPGPVILPRIWFEVCYRYADSKLIEKAKFQVRDSSKQDVIILEESLGPGGIGYVDLPAGPGYEFRFNADEVKLAFDAPEREGTVTPDTSGWVSQAIGEDLFAPGKKLVWKTGLSLTDYGGFAGEPSLSSLLLACVSAKGQPRRKTEPAVDDNAGESDKAADAAVAGLLRALLYADKAQPGDKQNWWREISFHRLRAVRPADGPVIERLLAHLHDRDDLKLDTVTKWLNARGKGNSVAWLKEIRGNLSGYRDEVASNIEQVLAAFDAELKKTAEPEEGVKDKISHANTVMASRLRERVAKLKPKEGLVDAWKTAEQRFDTLLNEEESKKTLRVWTAAKIKDREEYQQKQEKFPGRVPPQPPEIPWVELMFLYADGTPVKDATYKLTGGNPLSDKLDEKGFAFEIVEQGKDYEYEFSDDKNKFELPEKAKLKAKGADVGANLMEDGIAAGVFKKGGTDLVRWGTKLYTTNEDFKLNPDLSQIVNAVVRNKTPHIASDSDHEEITAFLFPLVMGKLLEKVQLDAVWKACTFHRLGGCLGEDGVVLRDLLYWLDQTDDPQVLDAVKRLNSVGHGDTHGHLKTLHGKFDDFEKAVSDNLEAIMDALTVELKKLTDANDNNVLPEMKRFAKDIDARAKQVKTDAAAKVKEALKTARDRLNTIQQKPAPEYKGSAPALELTIRQQEKTPLDPRPPAIPPKLAWFDLEYLHHDDKFVEDAEYVVTAEDGKTVLYEGKLSEGYAHLVVPENLKFKYFFRRDKAFVLETKCNANDGVNFPAAFSKLTRNAVLLKKFKKTKGGWGDCAMDDRKAFYADATVGKIAYNVIRGNVASPHMFDGKAEAKEMAELLHPLLLRTPASSVIGKATPLNYKDNSELWIHAVLNRLTVVLGENGHVVSSFLWAIHLAKTPVAKLAKVKLLEHLNWAGRGNAIRWLEGLDVLKDGNRDLVKASLERIFDDLKAELQIIKIRPTSGGGTQTRRRLASEFAERYSDMIVSRLNTERGNIANHVQTVFNVLRPELQEVLTEDREPSAGDLHKVNLLKQVKTDFPPRVPVIPPWIELQYCYNDEKPVANAQYELHDNTGIKDQGPLNADGYVYMTDIPPLTSFVFKQDPQAWRPTADVPDIPMYKKDEEQKRQNNPTPAVGYRSIASGFYHHGNYAANWARFPNSQKLHYNNFSPTVWTPDTLANYTLADYTSGPSLGKLARKCVVNNTAQCSVPEAQPNGSILPNYYPEENEAVDVLRQLLFGNPPGAPAPNNLLLWSVLVLNRVGTSRAAGLAHDESRIRKAVLLEIHRSNPTLTRLIEMLNHVGTGHAVGWLRQLYAQRANVEAGVTTDITATLTELQTECNAIDNYFKPNPPNPGPLAGWIRGAAVNLSNNIINIMNAGNVAARVHQVLNPIFLSLNALIPSDPLNPFPYHQLTVARKMNIFIQPEQPFPLAKPQPKTPPLWDLAHPNTIQVVYKNTAGGIVTADYTVDVTGTQVNRNAITNFNIGNSTTANYSFKNDAGAVAFSAPYKPWTNPYLPVTQGPDGPNKLLANFLTTLGVHNPPANPSCFDGRNDLPWEGTELNGRADFAARPSLGKILARSVLVNLPRVAMANDVQDLTMALQRLITKPVVHADLDEWFRAAVIYAGSKPDHGAVIRGLLLRVRKRGRLEADEFLKLINLADGGHGNAADWLRAQIVPGNDIHGSAAGLTAILTEFEARLGDIIALPNPPVNANLNNFLQGVVNASQVVRGVIAANVPACFNAHATTLDNMRTNDLPIQRIAYLGLNEYKREKAPFFIESSQAILPARKELIDADIKRRIVAANQAPPPHPPMGPPNVTRQRLAGDLSTPPYNNLFGAGNGQGVYSTLLAYMDGNRGQSAKTMAPKLAQMSNHEFVEHMESLVPLWQKVDSAWGGNTAGMGAMIQYYNPADGTLIRYKPGGDEYQRPQAPMYSVEVTRTNIADAMFKIDPNGNAVPFGPGGQTNANPYVGAEKSHYFDGISRAGHRSLRY